MMKSNKIKKGSLIMMLVVMMGILTVGCAVNNNGNANSTGAVKENIPSLSLGLMPSIDAIPFIIAHEMGFDQEHGVNLDIHNFKSAKDRDAAFQAGQLQGISTDLIAISIYNEAGMDVKITSTTFGEFNLLTGVDGINEVKDLKGKTVILSKNTSTQYTVAMMLKQAGLAEDVITITEVPQIPTRLELLKNNKADAAILPDPFVTMGKASGLKVLSSTTAAGVKPFVLAFPQEMISSNEQAILAMYAAYDDAVTYLKTHDQSEYIDIVIKVVGFPEDLKKDIQVPDYLLANQVDVKDVESAFTWARDKGLLTKNLTPEDVISNVAFKK
ncbi:ABC transporter substrate-binding protein [Paenibacillus sp. CMAA1364]